MKRRHQHTIAAATIAALTPPSCSEPTGNPTGQAEVTPPVLQVEHGSPTVGSSVANPFPPEEAPGSTVGTPSPISAAASNVTKLAHTRPGDAARIAADLFVNDLQGIASSTLVSGGAVESEELSHLSDAFVTWSSLAPADAAGWAENNREGLASALLDDVAGEAADGKTAPQRSEELLRWMDNLTDSDLRQEATWKYAEALVENHDIDSAFGRLRELRHMTDRNAAQMISLIVARNPTSGPPAGAP